jgi:iron complex outermembrane receptor protein
MKAFSRTRQFRSWQAIKATLVLGLAPTLAMTPLTVQAQGGQQLEEVTVTARQIVENLQDVPVAVTVFSESQIQRTFAQNLREFGAYAPNVSIGAVPGFNAASIAIRGVSTGDIPASFEPAVTVAVDGFYLGHYQASLLDMFDIQQIEILRGPQGTLFGKNTIGGVVNVTTKRPSGEFGVQGKVRAGNEGRLDLMGAVDFPIIEDKLAARIAVQQFDFDGFYENTYDGSDAGGQDLLSARIKLLWTPSDTFEAMLTYENIDDDSDTPMVINTTTAEDGNGYYGGDAFYAAYPGRGANGPANVPLGDPFKSGLVPPSAHLPLTALGAPDTDGHEEQVDGIYLNVNWEVFGGTLTSISGYRKVDSDYYNDYFGEPLAIYATVRVVDRETYSQEFRFAQQATDDFNYVVGLYYQDNKYDYENYTSLGPDHPAVLGGVYPPEGLPLYGDGSQDGEAYAVFAEGNYDITDALRVTLGARYSDEEKDFDLLPLGVPEEGRAIANDSWDDVTYRAGIDYALGDNMMAYFTYASGFKSGGFNEQAGSTIGAQTPYDPEEADSFELGLKSDLFDNTLRLNLAAFYVEYTDLQLDGVVPIDTAPGQESRVTNAAEVNAYGVEADMLWLITEQFTIDGTIGYLDSEYDDFDCNLPGDAIDGLVDCTDLDVKRSPEWTGSLGATFNIPLDRWGGGLDLNANGTYTDEFFNDVPNTTASMHEDVWLLNASVSYTTEDEKVRVSVFGRNLTDEEYQTAGLGVANLWSFSTYGNPQTYGIEVDVRF